MNEGTTVEHAPSTNGHHPAEEMPRADAPAPAKSSRNVTARFIVPCVLIVTAIVVLRRMQRGAYA